jgi:polysaccharide export outer membrane protein
MSARKPELNIEVMPHDVISVTRARMVYVTGEVTEPGAFVLSERSGVSVPRNVAGSGSRKDEMVDLGKVLEGKSEDPTLHADEIVFVPDSLSINATLRAIEAGIQVGTGLLIRR